MTTATKPLPPHGTPSRARGRYSLGIARCSCRPCRVAENRYNKRRRYLTATGQSLSMNAAPVTQHLRQLFGSGAGWEQTSTAAECSKSTLSKLLHGRQSLVRRALGERILSIELADVTHTRISVPATGSIRKVRALMAIGHSCALIRQESGLDRTVVCLLVNGHTESIYAATAEKVSTAYRLLSERQGTSVRNRNRAAREHWAPPAAWDDDKIDDPQAKPDFGDRVLNFHERAELRREEIIHFAWHGDTPEQILDRLNGEVSISTVRQVVQDWRTGQKRQRPNRVRPERQQKELAA